jgi:hypothetical protein
MLYEEFVGSFIEVKAYLRRVGSEALSIVFGQNESDDVMYEDSAQKLSIAFHPAKCDRLGSS